MGVESYLNPAAAIGGAVLGGVQFFSNMAKEKKNKAELASLKSPFYKIQDEYYNNQNLASGLSQNGLPTASKDFYTEELDRGLGTGVSGTLQSGGNPNDIAKLFSIYDKGIDRTASADAEAKIKNIQYYMGVNKDVAGQKTTQWAINEYKPIEERRKQLTQNIAANQQNAANGANAILGSVGALGTSLQNNKLFDKLMTDTGTSLPTTANSPLSNGFPMGINPTTGLPASDDAAKQAAGYHLDYLTGQWVK